MTTLSSPAILPQEQAGFCRVRLGLTAGDVDATTVAALCELSRKYGRGDIRATLRHELEIPSVKESDAQALAQELADLGLRTDGLLERPNVVACTGGDQCSTAYVRTKKVCQDVEAFLREAADDGPLPLDLRVALSGCPNECSHVHLNDIGFVGSVGEHAGAKVRGFTLVLGGSSRGEGRLAEPVAFLRAEDVVPTLRDLLNIYQCMAPEGRRFTDFYASIARDRIAEALRQELRQRLAFVGNGT